MFEKVVYFSMVKASEYGEASSKPQLLSILQSITVMLHQLLVVFCSINHEKSDISLAIDESSNFREDVIYFLII